MHLQQPLNKPEHIQSPLNYTGGKFKLLPQILPLFPTEIDVLVDLFCGGGNVGINAVADRIVLNDSNRDVMRIFQLFKQYPTEQILNTIDGIIDRYELSDSRTNGYSFYHCESSGGLSPYNKERYNRLRYDLNHMKRRNDRYFFMLFTLIVFAFNNQIRFNEKKEFNLPVGKRDFNDRMRDKVVRFTEAIKNPQIELSTNDFSKIKFDGLSGHSLIYADPPYLVTCASYNEGNSWNTRLEKRLLAYLDRADEHGIKFALSNVLRNGNKENTILREWINRNPRYIQHNLNYNYSNSSYHKKDRSKNSTEVLITNF